MRAKLGNILMYLSPVPAIIIVFADLQQQDKAALPSYHPNLAINMSFSAANALLWLGVIAGFASSVLLLGKLRLLGLAVAWAFIGLTNADNLSYVAYDTWWIIALVATVAALLPEDSEAMDKVADGLIDMVLSAFIIAVSMITLILGYLLDAVSDVLAPASNYSYKLRHSEKHAVAKRFVFGLVCCAAAVVVGFGIVSVAKIV